ncbi:hypothetical protein FOIG_14620 [Fusarium odoratissimum NRRL 54006]|uniref:Uncharacterized protein n=2 Tax=Fusarium oxysporum species complex TaxID=171631 RepID=X0J7U9_FUSO5|nr:uncharacterized protein FOIG_14620 [Fusarium odoratissimum NRRL 54006]EXL92421.1 hypothetical protein FOIG_14620 [Fusarium odoratissimum NRRL 54006]TXC08309.1 hypothetical protein FocTR4_00003425 [Fusarium oxysporum f. sp. cubense]
MSMSQLRIQRALSNIDFLQQLEIAAENLIWTNPDQRAMLFVKLELGFILLAAYCQSGQS